MYSKIRESGCRHLKKVVRPQKRPDTSCSNIKRDQLTQLTKKHRKLYLSRNKNLFFNFIVLNPSLIGVFATSRSRNW